MRISVHKIEKVELRSIGEVIYLFGRNEKREKIILKSFGHKPHFYVKEGNAIPVTNEVESTEYGYRSVFNDPLIKINTVNSNDVPKIRQNYAPDQCFEDDVLYTIRWAIDTGIKNGVELDDSVNLKDRLHIDMLTPIDFYMEPRRLHIDIEVALGESGKFPDLSTAANRITAISLIDSYTKKVISLINKPSFGGKYTKKTKLNDKTVLYSEDKPVINKLSTKLTTEVGTSYDWDIYKLKSQSIVYFSDSTLTKAVKKELTEHLMLENFLKLVKKLSPDFLCGWNIEGFDIPYIFNRLKRLNMDYRGLSPINSVFVDYREEIVIKGLVVFDTMEAYKKLNPHTVSAKLTDAANEKLGYGKVKYTGSLDNLYEQDELKFIKYNAVDVVSEYEIYNKLKMNKFFGGLRKFIGCPYESMFSNKDIVDFFFLNKAKANNIALPSNRAKKTKVKYSGAYVPIPTIKGRTKHVLTLDLKSLYPTIMITWNLGNDTLCENISLTDTKDLITTPEINGKKNCFYRNKQSFIGKCLEELITYRDELRFEIQQLKLKNTDQDEIDTLDNIQKIVKFITNSIYGVLGHANFRLYDIRIAECVTTIGRMILKDTIAILEKYNLKVLGGDTDSCFVKINVPTKEKTVIAALNAFETMCLQEQKNKFTDDEKKLIGLSYILVNTLNNSYGKYNSIFNLDTNRNYIQNKPEDISLIFFTVNVKDEERVAKKHYAKRKIVEFEQDRPIKTNSVEIKGFLRSDLSIVGNKGIKQIMNIICEDKENQQITTEIQDYLRAEINKIVRMDYPLTDICRRTILRESINSYGNVEHARAARWTREHANLWGGVSTLDKGSTINYIFVQPEYMPTQYSRCDVIALDDNNYLPDNFKSIADTNKIINKSLIEPLSEVLDGLDISYNYIKTGKQEQVLF